MPNASSTESVPKVASCLVDRKAMEPVLETMSTSSHPHKEEVEDVVVSYEDL